jgi:hypothetical protein
MAPECNIQSEISFKMSGDLDEILAGSPEVAKGLLQQAGLNYFLVPLDTYPVSMLIHSRLFSPDTIAKHLAVRWTDGSTYLLTWSGTPGTTALPDAFLESYRRLVALDEHPWFRFGDFVVPLHDAMREYRATGRLAFEWRNPPGIHVVRATYGANCAGATPPAPFNNSFSWGNATRALRAACDGRSSCDYAIDVMALGDPVNGCQKDFALEYVCSADNVERNILVAGEADGHAMSLRCPSVTRQ